MLTLDFGTCQGGVLRRIKSSTLSVDLKNDHVPRSKILLTEGGKLTRYFGFDLARVILFLEVVFIP